MQAHRKFILVLAFASALAAGGCSAPAADRAAEDLAILRAVLSVHCSRNGPQTVVTDMPAQPHEAEIPLAVPPDIRFGLDLTTRQAGSFRWPLGKLCPSVLVAADEGIKETFARETKIPPSGEFFVKEFNGASRLVGVSLPVYSADGERAVVYTSSRCGVLCGSGFYIEFRKTRKGWKRTNSTGAWIS